LNDPNSGDYRENYIGGDMNFEPGIAGKDLLVDADNTPITRIHIVINSLIPRGESSLKRKLSIISDLTDENPGRGKRVYSIGKHVAYEFQENSLHLLRGKNGAEPMSDEYATHLFETLDKLIPRISSPLPQIESRTRLVTPTPKALPITRRIQPPGR
jgi:hypothetical protein